MKSNTILQSWIKGKFKIEEGQKNILVVISFTARPVTLCYTTVFVAEIALY
jgi:hypothetical protein